MKLILARHGNTFNANDKVCWVGSQNDLPLVETGLAQAKRAGDSLRNVDLAGIYCAPLKRTKKFAEIIGSTNAKNAPPPVEEKRLTELDYGNWSGLSDAEIVDKFGEKTLRDWIDKSVWPKDGGWSSNEKAVTDEIHNLVEELKKRHPEDAKIVMVSSNGRLRYFLKLIDSEFERRVAESNFKVATGRVCLIDITRGAAKLELWNEQPELLAQFLEN